MSGRSVKLVIREALVILPWAQLHSTWRAVRIKHEKGSELQLAVRQALHSYHMLEALTGSSLI